MRKNTSSQCVIIVHDLTGWGYYYYVHPVGGEYIVFVIHLFIIIIKRFLPKGESFIVFVTSVLSWFRFFFFRPLLLRAESKKLQTA